MLAFFASLWLSRALAAPLVEASDVTRRVADGDLGARMAPPRTGASDEAAELARSVNEMGAALERARGLVEEKKGEFLRVLGPVDAPMARKAGRYRAQLLLQSSDRRALHGVLAALRPELENDPAARKVRWSIDVDPIELW